MSAISIHRLRGAIAVCISLSASACLCVAAGAQGVLPVSSASAATSSTATALPELAPLPDAPGGAVTSGLVLPTPRRPPRRSTSHPARWRPSSPRTTKSCWAQGVHSRRSLRCLLVYRRRVRACDEWKPQLRNGSRGLRPPTGRCRYPRHVRRHPQRQRDVSALPRRPALLPAGPSHNFFARLVYAGTRPLITRSDSGHASLNLALLSGTLGGSALHQPLLSTGQSRRRPDARDVRWIDRRFRPRRHRL